MNILEHSPLHSVMNLKRLLTYKMGRCSTQLAEIHESSSYLQFPSSACHSHCFQCSLVPGPLLLPFLRFSCSYHFAQVSPALPSSGFLQKVLLARCPLSMTMRMLDLLTFDVGMPHT